MLCSNSFLSAFKSRFLAKKKYINNTTHKFCFITFKKLIINWKIVLLPMQLGQKPKSLFCYICGREFGTSSLHIHLKSCMKKFEQEQQKKQPKNRIKCPEPPEELAAILLGQYDESLMNIYNEKACHIHKYKALPSCRYCGRTFNEGSLKAHENGCSKKGEGKNNDHSGYKLPDTYKKPRTLTCCVCGREFGLTSLKIHYPQCIQKFKNQQKKKPKEERKATPQLSEEQLDLIMNKEQWTLEEIESFNNRANGNYRDNAMVQCSNCKRKFIESAYLKHKKNCVMINGKLSQNKDLQTKYSQDKSSENFKKPRVLMCHICGREFGLTSLQIHQKQCEVKFANQQKKKPKHDRKNVPNFPQGLDFDLETAQNWPIQKIQEFNRIANEVYRQESLLACPICGRKFFQESLPKHLKFCEKNAQDQKNTSSQKKLKKINNPVEVEEQKSLKKINKKNILSKKQSLANKNLEIQEKSERDESSSPVKESFLKKSFYNKLKSSRKKSEQSEIENEMKQAPEQLEETQKQQAIETEKEIEDQQQLRQSSMSQQPDAKSYAAPRKKEENILSQMKECPHCCRKFPDDRIQKHKQICKQSKLICEKQKNNKKSFKRLNSESSQNSSNQLKKKTSISQNFDQGLTPEEKIKSSKGFAAPRMKQENLEASKRQCIGCGRKFNEDRIQKHESICKQAKQQLAKKDKNIKESIQQVKQEVEQKQSIKRIECDKCGRKFAQDRIEKHKEVCKGKKDTSKKIIEKKSDSLNDFQKKIQNQIQKEQSFQLRPCPKCERKFAVDRIQKHVEVCKGKSCQRISDTNNQKTKQKIEQNIQKSKYKIDESKVQESQKKIELEKCEKCSRKFATDRIQKHTEVCQGQNQTKQKIPNTNRILRKETIPQKLNLSPEIQKVGEDQYVEQQLEMCDKCQRKFNINRIQKHRSICKGTKIKDSLKKTLEQDEIRKTKNQFFKMAKDIKERKKKEQQIHDQLEMELKSIQTNKITKKQNTNQMNKPKGKEKSVNLPKI